MPACAKPTRCKAEARLAGGPVAELIGRVYERCPQLEPELEEAVEQRDALRVEEVGHMRRERFTVVEAVDEMRGRDVKSVTVPSPAACG